MEKQFESNLGNFDKNQTGNTSAKCPSNIALIKYWGKREVQIPMNPSLSFTLNKSFTETKVIFLPKTTSGFDIKVYFEGNLNEKFVPKIEQFFERILPYCPFLENFQFEIHTENTFPHSSGIASSASGLGALSLCLVEIEEKLGAKFLDNEKLKKASFLARLGSGSACRSVYPGITVWGESDAIQDSSDLFAIPYPYEIHENMRNFYDAILLVEEGEKEVSSTIGHNLMKNHPYSETRFESAKNNLKEMISIIKNGDLEAFGKLIEHEALSLHAMMMTSNPYFILMKPNTLKIIETIWNYRKETNSPIYFTLDAGANVHVLYPEYFKKQAENFIEISLKPYCSNGKIIYDYTF